MKRTKFLAYVVNFFSMSAVAAGLECQMNLAHVEDLYHNVAEKIVSVESGKIRSGNLGTLYVESQKRGSRSQLDLHAVLTGWDQTEDANFVVIRKLIKKDKIKSSVRISEILNLKAHEQKTFWFDQYRLDINCH